MALVACAAGAAIAVGLYSGLADRRQEPPKRAPVPIARQAAPVPLPKPAEPAESTYTLRKRETLWIICNRFYADGDLAPALARYNGIRSVTRLRIGQEIKLPPEGELRKTLP